MTDAPRRPPDRDVHVDREKHRTLLELLDRDEGLVAIHLDARRPGVSVPPHLRGELALRLDIAYGFNLPRLEIDDEGVEATLSFGGRNYTCFLPWYAIFSLSRPRHEGEGFVWPESLPVELRGPMTAALAGPEPAPAAQAASPNRAPVATIPPESGRDSVEATGEMEERADTPKKVQRLTLAPKPEAETSDEAPPKGAPAPAPPGPSKPPIKRPALRLIRDNDE